MNIQSWIVDADGPLTEAALITKLMRMGYRCTRYDYPPGTAFKSHSHILDKIDAVLHGQFRIDTPQGNVILSAGDFLQIPAGMLHSAEVIGDETVVSIDAVKIGK